MTVEKERLTREILFSDVYVARRMLWAAKWSTTRVEDEFYSLMGLIHVNMAPIYGEGRYPFRRLQQEIMKRSFDTSFPKGDRGENTALRTSRRRLMVDRSPRDVARRVPAKHLWTSNLQVRVYCVGYRARIP